MMVALPFQLFAFFPHMFSFPGTWRKRWPCLFKFSWMYHPFLQAGDEWLLILQNHVHFDPEAWSTDFDTNRNIILCRWWFQIFFNIFYIHHYLGTWSKSTNIVQMGWFNHQLEYLVHCCHSNLSFTLDIWMPLNLFAVRFLNDSFRMPVAFRSRSMVKKNVESWDRKTGDVSGDRGYLTEGGKLFAFERSIVYTIIKEGFTVSNDSSYSNPFSASSCIHLIPDVSSHLWSLCS